MESQRNHAAVRVEDGDSELNTREELSSEFDVGNDDEDDMNTFQRAVGSKVSEKKNAFRKYRRRGPVSGSVVPRDIHNETEDTTMCIKGRLEGAAKNCTYDLEALYSSLSRSKEWSAFYEEDFVYIFSKKYQNVDTIPLHDPMEDTPVALLNPAKDSNSFSKQFTAESKQRLGSNISVKVQKKLVARKHIFVFQFGAIVTWGGAAGTARKVYSLLRPYENSVSMGAKDSTLDEDSSSSTRDTRRWRGVDGTKISETYALLHPHVDKRSEEDELEMDDMLFCYDSSGRLKHDLVCLTSTSVGEKLAISFAFAQSMRLSVFEVHVDNTFNGTSRFTKILAGSGMIMESISEREVAKAVGHLFTVRMEVNLNLDILSTPTFFWDDDKFEPVYITSSKYLEISKRLEVLNKKLDVIGNLLDVLQSQLTNEHANKLEWIIIVLIFLELIVQVVWNIAIKDILNWFPSSVHVISHHTRDMR